jgi:sodium/potassium-transporting ATPase subunit alpha
MQIQCLPADEALSSLKTSRAGLHPSEAASRLAVVGPNHVEEVKKESLFLNFAREFIHFFAIILWVGAALAFIAEYFDPGQGMFRLGVAIIGVIVINGVFSFWQEYKAERAVAALRQLLPQTVKAWRDGEVVSLPAAELVPGDIVLLEEGNRVPADCRLVESFALRVNTATVTGESVPRAGDSEPSVEASFLFAKNIVLAGTSIVSGQGRAVVYATGMRTEFGKIAHLTQTAGEASSPLQREITRLSRVVAALATSMGIGVFLTGHAMGLPTGENMLFAIGIIVANVPEGLLPTVTLSLAMATQRMAKRNALVRHLPAVEALGSTTTICCDKTGTLTQNLMAVKRSWLRGKFIEQRNIGTQTHVVYENVQLFLTAALCHNLNAVEEHGALRFLGDPMEIALANLGRQAVGAPEGLNGFSRLDEIPFDATRKRMSVLCQTPNGRMLCCKGAPETVLDSCAFILLETGIVPLDAAAKKRVLEAQDLMASAGLRVLAFAHSFIVGDMPDEERGMILSGMVGMEDPPRPEVADAIARCNTAGIRIIMVTGDHPHTAVAIAREIGLVKTTQPLVIGGEQLQSMSPAQLEQTLDAREIIFARVSAEQKMRIVQMLQHKGEIVAVTGDGVNDAPALKTADIGIAMGIGGTDVAKEAADLILLDDNFASIVAAIEEGRAVFENIRKFLTYILSSNIPELVPYLCFIFFKIPLPLTIIQILAVDLGTDMVPALALGAEKPDPGVMTRPPRARGERLLSWGLLARAYLFLGVIQAAVSMVVFFIVLNRAGWHYGEVLGKTDPIYLQATTACLVAIVVTQVINVFLCRHPWKSSLSFRVLSNPLILIGIAAEICLIAFIVYTSLGNWLFGTAPVGSHVWLLAVGGAACMWVMEESRKVWVRRFHSLRECPGT